MLAGPIRCSLAPGAATASGGCTLTAAATVLSVGPHMHKLGVHVKVSTQRALAGSVVLYDGPYSFDSQ